MKKPAPFYFLPALLVILIAAVLFHAYRHGSGGRFADHIGNPVPPTALPLLQSPVTLFNTADWKGRAYAVNFFASWCPDCRPEHERLLDIKNAGVPVIGIAYKDDAVSLRGFLESKGDPYLAVAMDETGKAFTDWGLTGVPETLIVDKTGVIRFHYIGPMTKGVVESYFMPAWKETQ